MLGYGNRLRAYLGLHLRNRAFKFKKAFGKSIIFKLLSKVRFDNF
jgi:hypothetical protein